MATITAIYQPFLVAVRNTAIGTHWGGGGGGGGAVLQMFDKTPATEKFPKLHPHSALNRANTVLYMNEINTIYSSSVTYIPIGYQ